MADKPFTALVADASINIVRIGHEEHRCKVMEAVSETGQSVNDFRLRAGEPAQHIPGNGEPVARSVHIFFRERHIPVTEILRSVKFNLLISHNLSHHLHLAVFNDDLLPVLLGKAIDDPDICICHGIGVVIHIDLVDKSRLSFEIELVHIVLLRFYHVDGIVMNHGKGAVPVYLGDYFMCPCLRGVNDHYIFRIDAPEAHFIGGIAFRRPVPPVIDPVQDTFFLQIIKEFLKIFAPEAFSFLEGKFKGGTLQVVKEYEEIFGIDAAVLR